MTERLYLSDVQVFQLRVVQSARYKQGGNPMRHILTSNLDDTADIMRTVRDMNKKANSLLCTFYFVDPQVKSFLLKFYCLSLYGCCLWTLSAPSIRVVEVALNKILRKIWRLPPRSHSAIAHCVAQVHTISNLVFFSFKSYLVFISSH